MKHIEKFVIALISGFIVFISMQFSIVNSQNYYMCFGDEQAEIASINIPSILTSDQKEQIIHVLDSIEKQQDDIVFYTLYEKLQRKVYVSYNEGNHFFKKIKFLQPYTIGAKYSKEQTIYFYDELGHLKIDDLYGNLYVQSKNEEFISKLSFELYQIDPALNAEVSGHYTMDEQKEAMYKDWLIQSITGLGILILLYCAILLFDIIKKQRKISLYKLNGLALNSIMKEILLKRVILFLFMFFLIVILGYVFIANNGILMDQYVFWLMITFFLMLILMVGVYGICFFIVNKMKILDGIKNKYSHFIIFTIHYVLKGIFAFIAILCLMMSMQSFISLIDEYQLSTTLLENVNTKIKIDSFSNQIGGTTEEMLAYSNKIQEIVKNNQGMIYIDTFQYDKRHKNTSMDEDAYDILSYLKNGIRVNTTYLNLQNIKDVDNQNISDAILPGQSYLLIPQSMMDRPEVKTVKANPNFQHYQLIEIKDDQRCYTYQPGYIDSKDGFISNNYIVIDDQFDISHCLIDVGTQDLELGFKKWCQVVGIDANDINVSSVENDLALYMDELKTQVLINVIEFVMIFLGIVFLIYQYLTCYIEKNRRKIFIHTIHGETLLYKYQEYYKSQMILYALIMVFLFVLGYQPALIYVPAVLILDFMFTYLISYFMDKNVLVLERRGYYDYR
ncbi:DUF1430 domain-containing protein [[Eubacterium] hominis]|uniref:DUF1430 domain-containing protein n=1 Tax=[Eubacterium] hominis TaxID=2764325 RepID=UPI003A4E58B6